MKTPASVKWHLWEYARCKGSVRRKELKLAQLEKLIQFHQGYAEKYRAQALAVRASLEMVNDHLRNLDVVLKLHQAGVDTADVSVVRPQTLPCLVGYGGITRVIYQAIRESEDGTVMTSDIVARIITSTGGTTDHKRARERVQVRLAIMAKSGKLVPLSPNGLADRRWALPGQEGDQ